MANKTINQLENINVLSGTNLFPLYHNLSTYSTRLSAIEKFIVDNINLNKTVSAYFDPNIKYSVPLSDNTVVTNSISSKAVTNDKLADLAVNTNNIISNSITTEKLSSGSVTSDKLASGSVASDKLSDNSVINSKISDNSINSNKLSSGSVTTDKLADSSVTKQKLGDVVKVDGGLSKDNNGIFISTDNAVNAQALMYDGVKWVPKDIEVSDFKNTDALGNLYPQGTVVSYNASLGSWVASPPEITVTTEQGYIKRLANCFDAGGNYAAVTNDNRVIAWGTLNKDKFGGSTTATNVEATKNVRVPFWNNYDGYKNPTQYFPYGGDYLDENKTAVIGDVLWNSTNGMALVYGSTNTIVNGGDVWVCGTNGGIVSAAYADPTSIAISNDNDGYVVTENAKTTQSTLTRIVPEMDFRDMNALSAVPKSKHIIPNKYSQGDGSVTPNISLSSVKEQYYFSYAHGVKFVDSLGNIKDIAGSATISNATSQKGGVANDGDNGSTARFSTPNGIAQDTEGVIYVCDTGNHNIKRIRNNAARNVMVIAGIAAENGASVQTGSTDGRGTTAARFDSPRKIVIHPTDNKIMYVSDSHRIRKMTIAQSDLINEIWYVTTIAGFSASGGIVNGVGNTVRFNTPAGLALNKDGSILYIADTENKCIRSLNTTTSAVSTYVSGNFNTAAKLNAPFGICKGPNNNTLFVFEYSGHKIAKVDIDPITKAGTVTRLAGSGTAGSVDAATLSASTFNGPINGLYLNDKLYISENVGHRIRMIDFTTITPTITTIVGTGTGGSTDSLSGNKATVNNPHQMATDGTHIYIADYASHKIRRLTPTKTSTTNNPLTTIAGKGTAGGVDSLSAINATFNGPTGIVYDNSNNCLYVCDYGGHTIRKITLTFPYKVETIAGLAATTGNINSEIGINARFNVPYYMKLDGNYLYVCEIGNECVRRITLTSPYKVETIIGTGTASTKYGDGAVANIKDPTGLEIIGTDMYITQYTDHVVSKASTNFPYKLQPFVGTLGTAGSDNTGVATIDWKPYGLTIDDNEMLYFTDISGDRVGKINTLSPNKEISFFQKFPIGNMGIGAKTDKATSGFIKTNIIENGVEVKFKTIKRGGSAKILFAALDVNDSLWVWGTSIHGAFGIGHGSTAESVLPPTKVKRFSGQIKEFEISCSDANNSIITIITKDNKMYAAGTNNKGQLARNNLTATYTHREFKFEECLKNINGVISIVDNASKLATSFYAGASNNFYIDTSGEVWACGNNTVGLLGNGNDGNTNQSTFVKINDLSNVKKLLINGSSSPIAYALTNDGKIFSWGYNGAAKGQTLTNEITLANIKKPTRCWNFDKKSEVDNAVDIFMSDNTAADQALIAYLDSNKYVYFGGYKADVAGPDFADNIPYFKRFNVKNVTNDVLISGEDALVHRENGTTYQVKSIGPQKVF